MMEVEFSLVLSLLISVSLGLSKGEATLKTNGQDHMAI